MLSTAGDRRRRRRSATLPGRARRSIASCWRSSKRPSLHPAAEADPRTLIRRVYFDLVGLPPTPAEVEAFVAAPRLADAPSRKATRDTERASYDAVVDRLLASPHFGERWARHWLDLVRYAETRGHEFDPLIPNAYQYRDYVIRALNADVPYDRFVVEHMAGDLTAEAAT